MFFTGCWCNTLYRTQHYIKIALLVCTFKKFLKSEVALLFLFKLLKSSKQTTNVSIQIFCFKICQDEASHNSPVSVRISLIWRPYILCMRLCNRFFSVTQVSWGCSVLPLGMERRHHMYPRPTDLPRAFLLIKYKQEKLFYYEKQCDTVKKSLCWYFFRTDKRRNYSNQIIKCLIEV